MILVRSPLRITLGGGGTDLPSYAQTFGGFCLTASINKYVYVAAMRPFAPGIYLKYSEHERIDQIADVKHPIIREAMDLLKIGPQIEITTLADIPAGTGLGSSSSFTTALLQALSLHQHHAMCGPKALAEQAAHIEMTRLQEPIGQQDQYAAAYGGVTSLTFRPIDGVCATRLSLRSDVLSQLEDSLLLFYTGSTRSARSILHHQHAATIAMDGDMLQHLHHIKKLGVLARDLLLDGKLSDFGNVLHEHWRTKRQRSPGMTTPQIDAWYDLAMKNGAAGGKLVGAGAGGCLLFYTESPRQLRQALQGCGLEEIRFRFDYEGTKVLLA